ncbi:MAG: RimK/LysX family protein [Bacteroidota bacterium]
MAKREKIVIGRKEIVDFPELNLWGVPAKVDTGADTSSIHVRKLKLEKKGDTAVLTCYFGPRHKATFTTFDQTMVKSSNGIKQTRYVVKLQLNVFGREFETEFTLSDRKSMTFPVLLGKKFLRKRFVVDVSLSNLSQKNKLIIL